MNKNFKIPEFGISGDRIKGIAVKNLNDNSSNADGHNIRLPHRDDHYMLIMLKEGILKASIDSEEYEFSGPCLLMVFPKQVLAKANKKLKIQSKVDFEDLKESQFIELLRASSIISKEQKKILDDKLDIRNSAAHPNATSFKEAKTATFIEELLNDIVATLPTDAQSLHSH